MDDNEDIYPPPTHDISNVFVAVDLSSPSSFYSVKYKRAWLKAKVIRFSILFSQECPDTFSK